MTEATGRHAIVLAAGAGRRFGGGKLTAGWRGEPLILSPVRTALTATVETVTVVTGADEKVVKALAGVVDQRMRQITAADWAEGLAASLRAGIASLPPSARAVVIFLGDMPRVPSSLADALLEAVIDGAPAAVVRSPDGPAHPVAFGAVVFAHLLRLSGDRGARSVLEALGDRVVAIDCDDLGVVFDIDYPADMQATPGLAS